jgi:formate dehydrogenase (coenzyme F420) beta subunit
MNLTEKMRASAAEILEKQEADLVMGWSKGDYYWQSPPLFVEDAALTAQLVFDPFSVNNLAKYLMEELQSHEKAALFVKGCDTRGINRLLQDNRIKREDVLLIGVPCRGLADQEKLKAAGYDGLLESVERDGDVFVLTLQGDVKEVPAADFMLDKCLECKYPNPLVYDRLLEEEVSKPQVKDPMSRVREVDKKSVDEKYAYWQEKLSRCIRCYACRNVCPACNCRECIFDKNAPRWIGKANELSEKQNYNIVRSFHIAGRCIDCGECQRACPMDIPLMEINRKIMQDLEELYGEYEAGLDPTGVPPLGTYRAEDPAGFSER